MRRPLSFAGLAVAATLTLAACGDGDDTLSGSDRERASAAALKYVGGGTVTDAERGDGDDAYEYQVEVTLPNGTDIDVELDDSFSVTNSPAKASDFASEATPSEPTTSASQGGNDRDADDRPLTGDTLKKATDAALKATGGGRVTETSGSDDPDHVYEVEVDLTNGDDATVELDENFEVVRIDR